MEYENCTQELDKLDTEINFRNIQVSDDILTCIDDKGINKQFKLIKRKAKKNEIIYIVQATNLTPLTIKDKNKFFKVTDVASKELLEFVKDCVITSYCCVYDDQYLVLEEF